MGSCDFEIDIEALNQHRAQMAAIADRLREGVEAGASAMGTTIGGGAMPWDRPFGPLCSWMIAPAELMQGRALLAAADLANAAHSIAEALGGISAMHCSTEDELTAIFDSFRAQIS